jgi:hypothetical protein
MALHCGDRLGAWRFLLKAATVHFRPQRAPIMVSKELRLLSAAGKASVLSVRCVGLARRLNLTFTRL